MKGQNIFMEKEKTSARLFSISEFNASFLWNNKEDVMLFTMLRQKLYLQNGQKMLFEQDLSPNMKQVYNF